MSFELVSLLKCPLNKHRQVFTLESYLGLVRFPVEKLLSILSFLLFQKVKLLLTTSQTSLSLYQAG